MQTQGAQAKASCDLSIVIVSWNVWPLLQQCLASIERATLPGEADFRRFPGCVQEASTSGADIGGAARGAEHQAPAPALATLEVIVVDNASGDDTPALVKKHFPWVRVLASEKNLGFTGGNNLGFVASRGRFVYFLNPDTELLPALDAPSASYPVDASSHSIAVLYCAILADPTIGVIAPQLRYADGSHQPNARRFPGPLTGFFESTWLGRAWASNPWARAMLMADLPPDRRSDVDWVVGAAMLCRREALEAVSTEKGPFDEDFFMYSEEMDLCRRIKAAGWRVVYEPAAAVLHHEGKSSEQVSTQRHIRFNASKVYYWRKWFGAGWAEALRRYLLVEYALQIGVEWLKLRLGHKPALRRARIEAYREVLRSRLRPRR